MMRRRSCGAMRDHVPASKAARALLTASSTSAASQSATVPMVSPAPGKIQGKVLPDLTETHAPPMNALSGRGICSLSICDVTASFCMGGFSKLVFLSFGGMLAAGKV